MSKPRIGGRIFEVTFIALCDSFDWLLTAKVCIDSCKKYACGVGVTPIASSRRDWVSEICYAPASVYLCTTYLAI